MICLINREIRWLKEEKKLKRKRKLKKLREEEEEDSYFLLKNALLYFKLGRFFYSNFSNTKRPKALSIFFCTSSGPIDKTASNSDLSLS